MCHICIFLIFAALAEEPKPTPLLTPADAITAAFKDSIALPASVQPYIRYLSLYNLPDSEKANAARVLSFHCNSLSREAMLVPPSFAGGDTLLRLNILDYGWDAKTWEKLADVDPYFHVRIDTSYGYQNRDGSWTKTETRKETALAPWLAETPEAKKQLESLLAVTKSQAPVLRADWFFAQTAIQDGRVAGYYDFLGLGNKQADFDKLVGFDAKLADQFKSEIAGVVLRSTVALNNRRLVRFGKIGGAKWITLDARQNTEKRNFARVLDEGFEFDATEQIASLPNGLHAFWLANAQGVRQDTAPDFIASDSTTSGTDHRVHSALSCVRCHVEGIRPINDWVRHLVTPPLALQSPDYEKLKRLRQLYIQDLGEAVGLDSAQYARAVHRVNGLSLAGNAKAYGNFWARYIETDFDLARISREVGVPSEKILASLKEYSRITGALDPIVAGLLQNPPLLVRSEQWEEVFPIVQLALRGYVVPSP